MSRDKYILVLPIERMPEGGVHPKGESLPLHCTLVPWFQLGEEVDYYEFTYDLSLLIRAITTSPIRLSPAAAELFGRSHNIPVWVLKANQKLQELHNGILEYLESRGGFTDREWIKGKFRPHVTDTVTSSFSQYKNFDATSVVLLSRMHNGNRLVKHRFSFDAHDGVSVEK